MPLIVGSLPQERDLGEAIAQALSRNIQIVIAPLSPSNGLGRGTEPNISVRLIPLYERRPGRAKVGLEATVPRSEIARAIVEGLEALRLHEEG